MRRGEGLGLGLGGYGGGLRLRGYGGGLGVGGLGLGGGGFLTGLGGGGEGGNLQQSSLTPLKQAYTLLIVLLLYTTSCVAHGISPI